MASLDVDVAARALGQAIRERRTWYRLTQEQLADLAGVGTRSVHAIENGKATAQLGSVLALLDALGMTWPGTDRTAA